VWSVLFTDLGREATRPKLTLCSDITAIMPPQLLRYDSVGVPVPSAEVKLVDVEETGYLATNKLPQGEVCVRGPSVVKGYFKVDYSLRVNRGRAALIVMLFIAR
jgi:acyl-CoA synthetase (AMP-forming)/AMP-acid ligase II